jgi:hypothetical protein
MGRQADLFGGEEMSEPLEVTEHDIDAISCKVGFHASAWDCADQIELVRAIVSHFRPKASPIGYVRPGVLEALKAQDEPHERYPIQKRRGDGFEVPVFANPQKEPPK